MGTQQRKRKKRKNRCFLNLKVRTFDRMRVKVLKNIIKDKQTNKSSFGITRLLFAMFGRHRFVSATTHAILFVIVIQAAVIFLNEF